ncbi:MAG: methylated-DNA--[protein]-cysteine S-methyltransferase [Kiritimatiellia bacterium]
MMRAKVISKTPFGPVVIIWEVLFGIPKVSRVILSRPGAPASANAPQGTCAEVEALCKSIGDILEGREITIPLEITDMNSCSAFQKKILHAQCRTPRGQVTSYQSLAAGAGLPNGARAAGTALASNPFPLIIPCHRTIRSDGFPGEYEGGPAMKRALLEMEGVYFDKRGRVIR